MPLSILEKQLLGLDETHLVMQESVRGSHRLREPVWQAFGRLRDEAAKAGFTLAIASAYRSYARQLMIWNGKLRGERAVFDDHGRELALDELSPRECLACVLRFSAMPGVSRHHWGTDMDVFDAAAVHNDYAVQLTAEEAAAGGPFGPLHAWLDERIARGRSFGFYRPYDKDRGGVACEPWHLSFAPLATSYERECRAELLRAAWRDGVAEIPEGVGVLNEELEGLFERFVSRVGIAPTAALDYLQPAQ